MRSFAWTWAWMMVPALTAGVLLTGPAPAHAQQLTGQLRLADGRPAAGVLVIALMIGTDSVVARAATGTEGHFSLRIPVPVRLRALRIGHRPSDLGEFSLVPQERRTVSLAIPDSPIELSSVLIE